MLRPSATSCRNADLRASSWGESLRLRAGREPLPVISTAHVADGTGIAATPDLPK
jgi:hypothetical protein